MSKHDCPKTKSIIHDGKIISGCDVCIHLQQGNTAKYYRRMQQINYRRDTTQPNQKEFARAYPEQARKEWGDELARKYS